MPLTKHELEVKMEDAIKGRNDRLWDACVEIARRNDFLVDPTLKTPQMVEKAINLMTADQKVRLGLM